MHVSFLESKAEVEPKELAQCGWIQLSVLEPLQRSGHLSVKWHLTACLTQQVITETFLGLFNVLNSLLLSLASLTAWSRVTHWRKHSKDTNPMKISSRPTVTGAHGQHCVLFIKLWHTRHNRRPASTIITPLLKPGSAQSCFHPSHTATTLPIEVGQTPRMMRGSRTVNATQQLSFTQVEPNLRHQRETSWKL